MANESEIASRAAEFAEWMSEHWPWLSGSVVAALYVLKQMIQFFRGINRLADGQKEMSVAITKLADEQKKQREKLDRMVDGPGVDRRVEPVIASVSSMQSQISQIYDHLLNREGKRERAADK